MPSYRRDRPGATPPPSGFRRGPRGEEPEEEEREVRRPFLLEKEAPSEFASRPVSPSQRQELWEALVPESEREDPYFDYGQIFNVLQTSRRGTVPTAPPREAPSRAEPERRRPIIDAALVFDMNRIWEAVATAKRHEKYRPGMPFAVVQLAPAADLSRIFSAPQSEVQVMLEELAYSVNAQKPRDVPGRFYFQNGKDGFVWLAYVE